MSGAGATSTGRSDMALQGTVCDRPILVLQYL